MHQLSQEYSSDRFKPDGRALTEGVQVPLRPSGGSPTQSCWLTAKLTAKPTNITEPQWPTVDKEPVSSGPSGRRHT